MLPKLQLCRTLTLSVEYPLSGLKRYYIIGKKNMSRTLYSNECVPQDLCVCFTAEFVYHIVFYKVSKMNFHVGQSFAR